MFFKDIWEWIVKFWQLNFMKSLSLGSWGTASSDPVKSLAWEPICYWIILFIIFISIFAILLCKSQLIEKLSRYILPLSVTVWFLGVLIYIVGFYNSEVTGLSVVLRAIISSFKMFVVSNDLARIPQLLQNDYSYMAAFAILHFAAAFITFLFVFKVVGYKLKSSLRLMLHKYFYAKGETVHLFWGVNEASCLLAEDIRKHHSTDTIIFVDIDEENDDNSQKKATLSYIANTITIKNSEISRLDAIDALVDHCYNGPAAFKDDNESDIFGNLHLNTIGSIVHKCRRVYFYFLSDNEAQNIVGALNLQKDHRLRSMNEIRPVIYIHARRDANNEIFDHYSQYDEAAQRVKIKLVDSAYLSVATLKQDDRTLPVNCVKIDRSTGLVNSPFTAMVVGFGATGQEAFKFLYEYSAFIGSDMKKSLFKCYAIDGQMNSIAGLVREKMPAISENELSLIQAVVDSEEFWNEVRNIIKELNYVVIALNNDTIGLSLAVNLFKYALCNRPSDLPMLKILVRCYDNGNEKRMTEVASSLNKSIDGNNVEIRLFGQENKLYCCNTILSDDTLREAMEFNKVYEKSELSAEEQWQKNFGEAEIIRLMTQKKMSRYHAIYDINRRIAQNISNSLHGRTKMILMGFGENEQSERLRLYNGYANSRKDDTTKYECGKDEEQLLLNIAMVEHERWIASHKLMGYRDADVTDPVKKLHENMKPFDMLKEKTQSYDCNVVDTTIKMVYINVK